MNQGWEKRHFLVFMNKKGRLFCCIKRLANKIMGSLVRCKAEITRYKLNRKTFTNEWTRPIHLKEASLVPEPIFLSFLNERTP